MLRIKLTAWFASERHRRLLVIFALLLIPLGLNIHSSIEARNFNDLCEHENTSVSTEISLKDGLISYAPAVYLIILCLVSKNRMIDYSTISITVVLCIIIIHNLIYDWSGYDGECYTMGGNNSEGGDDGAIFLLFILVDIGLTVLAIFTALSAAVSERMKKRNPRRKLIGYLGTMV